MKKKIIFIGGIHGVGKGTLCKSISSNYNIPHYSSSEILKWEEISEKTNKLVKNISSTQDRLIKGLSKLNNENKDYLLDGHYCLLNSDKNPEKIDENTFELINPRILVVVTEHIEVIYNRLKERDDINYDLSLLEKMQNIEIEYAQFLSNKLNIPFLELKNGNISQLTEYL